jgi:hypothetical protein
MMRWGARLTIAVLASAALAPAQKVVSAKSGLVYSVEGRAWVDNGQLRTGQHVRQLHNGETLYTDHGKVELLLNPSTVLRMADFSRVRMEDDRLSDACMTILGGAVVVTIKPIPKPGRVELHIGNGVVVLTRAGVYRFDSGKFDVNQGRLRVYDGLAEAHRSIAGPAVMVPRGKSLLFEDLQLAKFKTEDADELQQWAAKQAKTVARPGLRAVPPRMDARLGVPPQQSQNPLESSERKLGVDSAGGPSGGPILSNPGQPTSPDR